MINKKNKCHIILLLFYSAFAMHAAAQNKMDNKLLEKVKIGTEAQWYPAGWLIGVAAVYYHRPQHVFFTKLGINIADRHNWSGLNDNEEGTGYGASLGYRFLFKSSKSTFFAGTRGELYNTFIKWKNNIGLSAETNGTTRIFVYQPSIEVGYFIKPPEKKWSIVLATGIGAEINIVTKGKPVGQGGMYLSSVAFYYALK
jgi:hypothetical protein